VIDQLFDEKGFVYYKITFPDGILSYTSCCWMGEILLKRWDEQKLAINYRGESLSSRS